MAVVREDQQLDSLANLEERISRAVETVVALRKENRDLAQRVAELTAERDSVQNEVQAAVAHGESLASELDELKAERKHVRERIEKLLGQMDLMSTP